jgi:hypothetical protein
MLHLIKKPFQNLVLARIVISLICGRGGDIQKIKLDNPEYFCFSRNYIDLGE